MRGLKILVIVMGVLLVAGVVALGVGISYRLNHRAAPGPMAARSVAAPNGVPRIIALPANAKILGVQSDGDRVAIRLGLADGNEELMLVDWQTGQKLATIELRR